MKKSDVIEFFDRCAPFWDEDMVRIEPVIAEILNCGGIRPGIDVLGAEAQVSCFRFRNL